MIIFSTAFTRKMDKIIETGRVSARRGLVSYVYDEMVATGIITNTTLREFKKFILKMNMEGNLELSTVDTVGKWGATQLKRSRIKTKDGTFFHLIHRKSKIKIAEKPVKRARGTINLSSAFVGTMNDIIATGKISHDKALVADVYKGLLRANKITTNTTLTQFKKFIKLSVESGKVTMSSVGLAAMWGGNAIVKKSAIDVKGKSFHLINRIGSSKSAKVLEYDAAIHSVIDDIINSSPISQKRALISYVYSELVKRKKISQVTLPEFKKFLITNKRAITLDFAESPDVWGRAARADSEIDSYHLIVHRTNSDDKPKIDSRNLSFSNFNPTGVSAGKTASTDTTVVLNTKAPPPEQTLIDIDNIIEKNKQSQYNAPISWVYDQLIKSKKLADTNLDTFKKSLLQGEMTGRIVISKLLRGDWDNDTIRKSGTLKGTALVNRSPAAARKDAEVQKGLDALAAATAQEIIAKKAAEKAKNDATRRAHIDQAEKVRIATAVVAMDIDESTPLTSGVTVNDDTTVVPSGLINQINTVIRANRAHPNQGTINNVYNDLVKTKSLTNTTLTDFKDFLEFAHRGNKGISLSYADHPDVWGSGNISKSAVRISTDVFHLINHSNPTSDTAQLIFRKEQGSQVIPVNLSTLVPELPFDNFRRSIEWIVRHGPISPRAAAISYVHKRLIADGKMKKISLVAFKTFIGAAHEAGNLKLLSHADLVTDTDFRTIKQDTIKIASGNYSMIANMDKVGYMRKGGPVLIKNEHDSIDEKFIPAIAEIIKLYPGSSRVVPISYAYAELFNNGNLGRLSRADFNEVMVGAWVSGAIKMTDGDGSVRIDSYILDASAIHPFRRSTITVFFAERGEPNSGNSIPLGPGRKTTPLQQKIKDSANDVPLTDFTNRPETSFFGGIMKQAAETSKTGWIDNKRVYISHAKENSIYKDMPDKMFNMSMMAAMSQGELKLSGAEPSVNYNAGDLSASALAFGKIVMNFIEVGKDTRGADEIKKRLEDPNLNEFATNIIHAAKISKTGKWGENRVFINHAKKNSPYKNLSKAKFDEILNRARKEELVTLSRLDIVAESDPKDIAESEISFLNSTFHLINTGSPTKSEPEAPKVPIESFVAEIYKVSGGKKMLLDDVKKNSSYANEKVRGSFKDSIISAQKRKLITLSKFDPKVDGPETREVNRSSLTTVNGVFHYLDPKNALTMVEKARIAAAAKKKLDDEKEDRAIAKQAAKFEKDTAFPYGKPNKNVTIPAVISTIDPKKNVKPLAMMIRKTIEGNKTLKNPQHSIDKTSKILENITAVSIVFDVLVKKGAIVNSTLAQFKDLVAKLSNTPGSGIELTNSRTIKNDYVKAHNLSKITNKDSDDPFNALRLV